MSDDEDLRRAAIAIINNMATNELETFIKNYINASMLEVEEIAKKYNCDYIADAGCHIADTGESLTDLLKAKAQR